MILEIQNFTQNKINEKLFQKVAERTLKTIDKKRSALSLSKGEVEISLAIVGHGRMRRLNKIYRGRNRVTDVLAFGDKSGLTFVQPPNGIKRLGEVIICYPQAKKQAKRLGHSLEKELTILLIHGILHLLGYEHKRGSREEMEMKKMEEKILKSI